MYKEPVVQGNFHLKKNIYITRMSFCNVIITRDFYIPEIQIGTFAFLKGHLGFEKGYRYGGLRQYINNNVD